MNTRAWLTVLGVVSLATAAAAERLPIRTYATVDGLPSNQINRIVRDSRGFLWLCTGDGLARFDGYGFADYSTDQGLPHGNVTDLLETHDHRYWVGTSGGLVVPRKQSAPDGSSKIALTMVTPSERS